VLMNHLHEVERGVAGRGDLSPRTRKPPTFRGRPGRDLSQELARRRDGRPRRWNGADLRVAIAVAMTSHDHGPGPPFSRDAITSPARRGATSSPSSCQSGVRPVLATQNHPSENHDERFSAAFSLARRDGLSRFRTCLSASVGSTEASGKSLRGSMPFVRLLPSTCERLPAHSACSASWARGSTR
jgi:hypothetical protein